VQGGVTEATRDVEVRLPASKASGRRSGEIGFRWSDGRREAAPLRWDVRPHLTVTPSGLSLRPSDGPIHQIVRVESAGGPFRVTSVSGSLLTEPVDFSKGAAVRHVLSLLLSVPRVDRERVLDVTISTDQREQRTVVLSVVVLRGAERGLQ